MKIKTLKQIATKMSNQFHQPYPNLAYHPMLNNVILDNTFKHLNVEDLKVCRGVCKYWKAQVRLKVQQQSKCKLWANCYEAPRDSNSINSFFLNFYSETEVDYIPSNTFHIINPVNDQVKRFIKIFGGSMQSLILEFQGSIMQNEAAASLDDLGNSVEEELHKKQIRSLLNFSELKDVQELKIEHARDHFDNLSYVNWVQSQNIQDGEFVNLDSVVKLTLVGRYTVNVFKDIFKICPHVENLCIMSNDLETVPSDVFRHLTHECRTGIQILKFSKCSISLDTLNLQDLPNVTLVEFNECEVIEVNGFHLLYKLFVTFPKLTQVEADNTYSGDTMWSLSLKQPQPKTNFN